LTGEHILIAWSDDEGRTWSAAISPFRVPPVDGRPGLSGLFN